MANEVLVDGYVGANPVDYPAKEGKKRFVRFDICQQAKKAKQPNWITVNAYGPIADKIVDGLCIGKGDKVRITGFLAGRFANPGCGRRHRFTVVVASDCLLIVRKRDPAGVLQVAPPWFGGSIDDLPPL